MAESSRAPGRAGASGRAGVAGAAGRTRAGAAGSGGAGGAGAAATRARAAGAQRGSFTVEPRGAFSLGASIRFLEGFAPAAFEGSGADASGAMGGGGTGDAGGRLAFAFALEGSWLTVGVSLTQPEGGSTVTGRVFAKRALTRDELSATRSQVERILSLDIDANGFAAVGEQDAVAGRLQQRYPGLRPVCFWSWYEAAAWAIIGQRTRMVQAAAVKRAISEQLGETVVVNGEVQHAFPAPRVLAGLEGFSGLTAVKAERLRALGEAARRNVFSSESLRAMPREESLEALRQLPGIGPFSAELVLLRGAGEPDGATVEEPRLARAVALAYGLPEAPSPAEIERLAEGWAPYRTWVSLLLRVNLEEAGAAS